MKARAFTGLALCKFLTQPAFLLISTRHEGLLFQGEKQLRLGALGTESGEEEQTGQPGPCRLNLKAVGGVSRGAGRRRKAAGQLVAAGRDLSPRALLSGRGSRESPGLILFEGPREAIPPNPLSSEKMGPGCCFSWKQLVVPVGGCDFQARSQMAWKKYGPLLSTKAGCPVLYPPRRCHSLHGLMCGHTKWARAIHCCSP